MNFDNRNKHVDAELLASILNEVVKETIKCMELVKQQQSVNEKDVSNNVGSSHKKSTQ